MNTSFVDTTFLRELNAENSFSVVIDFVNKPLKCLIYIENTDYSYTISETTHKREGCDEHIENFSYKFNGELHTDNELIIYE